LENPASRARETKGKKRTECCEAEEKVLNEELEVLAGKGFAAECTSDSSEG
jgi:hypothetical protein